MAGDWKQVPLGELVDIYDGPHATPKKVSDGPVFLGISSLAHGRLDLSNLERLSESDFARWTRRVKPQGDDIVFSYETRIGDAALIPDDLRCCLGRRMGLLRARPSRADSRFLLYAYLAPEFQDTLRARTVHGSTVDRLPLIEMHAFPIRVLTDIGEQRAISTILGSLDDKIELNRRMNATLEAMARAIFKSWFVDTSPEGSVEGKFADVASLGRETVTPENSPEEHFDHYSIPAFDERQLPALERGSEIKSNKLIVRPNSILLSRLNPRIQRAWFPSVAHERRSICSTEFLVLLPRQGISREWLYGLVSSAGFMQKFATFVTGTSGSHQRVKPETMLSMSLCIPQKPTIARFTAIVRPIYARISANIQESQVLASIRDVLLPKLISGELRIWDAEKIAGAVA